MNLVKAQKCDICGDVPDKIVDGPVKTGQWAWMCESCWRMHGKYKALGTGRGQLFWNVKGGEKLDG